VIVHWHRRDLRTVDNRGLACAASIDESIVPLFVLDPTVLEHASPVRVACLLEALHDLRSRYREYGSDLIVERGEASGVVPDVAAEYDASSVVWNEDYSGLARERDRAVRAALADDGVNCESVHDSIHHEPGSITPNQGEHYSVFFVLLDEVARSREAGTCGRACWDRFRDRFRRDDSVARGTRIRRTRGLAAHRNDDGRSRASRGLL